MRQMYAYIELFSDVLDFLDSNFSDNIEHIKGKDDHSVEITFKQMDEHFNITHPHDFIIKGLTAKGYNKELITFSYNKNNSHLTLKYLI